MERLICAFMVVPSLSFWEKCSTEQKSEPLNSASGLQRNGHTVQLTNRSCAVNICITVCVADWPGGRCSVHVQMANEKVRRAFPLSRHTWSVWQVMLAYASCSAFRKIVQRCTAYCIHIPVAPRSEWTMIITTIKAGTVPETWSGADFQIDVAVLNIPWIWEARHFFIYVDKVFGNWTTLHMKADDVHSKLWIRHTWWKAWQTEAVVEQFILYGGMLYGELLNSLRWLESKSF